MGSLRLYVPKPTNWSNQPPVLLHQTKPRSLADTQCLTHLRLGDTTLSRDDSTKSDPVSHSLTTRRHYPFDRRLNQVVTWTKECPVIGQSRYRDLVSWTGTVSFLILWVNLTDIVVYGKCRVSLIVGLVTKEYPYVENWSRIREGEKDVGTQNFLQMIHLQIVQMINLNYQLHRKF